MQITKDEVLIFVTHLISHLVAAAVGWVVGYFNSTLGAGVVIIFGLYSWHVTFQESKAKKAELTRRVFRDEKGTIQQIFEDVPRWVFFPDIERAEWLNKILVQVWPDITSYIFNYISNDLESAIRESLPSKLQTFRFSKVDLGDLPPKVSGIKVYETNTSRDEVIVDIDIFYAGDANLSLAISKFSAGIKRLQIRSTARVIFKPLLDKPPFIGGVKIYLLKAPVIGFDLTDVASVFEIPGLYNLLKKGILSYVSRYLVLPNMLTFSLSDSVGKEQLKVVEPQGVLKVTLIEAKDLKSCDLTSKSDPYAVLEVGGQRFTSSVVKNSNDPVWTDEVFHFTVMELEEVSLNITLYDDDDSSKDDTIGLITLSLQALMKEADVDMWKQLGEDLGSVHIRCQWYRLTSDKTDISNIREPVKPSSVVSVYLDSAHHLCNTLTPTVDPSSRVKLTIGSKELISKPVHQTPKPNYEENFTFLIHNPHLESLTANVLDVKSKKSLGTVSVPLSRCLDVENMTLKCQPYNMRSGSGSELLMRISVKYLMPAITPDVIEETQTTKPPSPATSTSMSDLPLVTPSTESGEDNTSFRTTDSSLTLEEADEMKDLLSRPRSSTIGSFTPPVEVKHFRVDSTKEKVNEEIRERVALDKRRKSHGDVMLARGSNRVAAVGSRKSSLVDGNKGLGQIQLSINYNIAKEKLKITLHQCRDLRQTTDCYVKFYILPDKDSKKSQIVKDTSQPVFNESVEFDVKSSEVSRKMLEVTVKSYESMFSREELGQVLIRLADFDLPAVSTRWFALEPAL